MKKAGIVVILIGLALTMVTAFTFFTREKIADLGDVHISVNRRHYLSWSPVAGIIVMGIGGLMLFLPSRR